MEPQPDWAPVNETEQALAIALNAGDARAYARTVLSAQLYVAVPPAPETVGWPELVRELGADGPHLLVFTSLAGLSTVVGRFVENYRETDFATLARFWPDPSVLMALNPGLPINATLPLHVVTGLADGDQSLVPTGELATVASEEAQDRVRAAVLAELGGADIEPSGPQEALLVTAAHRGDVEAFLDALMEAEVVVPTTTTVTDPKQIIQPDFPWHSTDVGGMPVITIFSSEKLLAASHPRVVVPFLAAVAGWPGEEHLLCFNPGTRTELFLSGEALMELVDELAELAAVSGS
jgi:hypothetical protein